MLRVFYSFWSRSMRGGRRSLEETLRRRLSDWPNLQGRLAGLISNWNFENCFSRQEINSHRFEPLFQGSGHSRDSYDEVSISASAAWRGRLAIEKKKRFHRLQAILIHHRLRGERLVLQNRELDALFYRANRPAANSVILGIAIVFGRRLN